MKNDSGNLSIDFLAGFTIFMLAFIWVATIIPTLLLGLQANTIDYDAVAYRSGVILVEDPGMPANPPWENKIDAQKDEVLRMGLTLNKETPNILSPVKINKFFSPNFTYPDDYQQKVIFGDHPYMFNISIRSFDNSINQSLGDIRPIGYGYVRRVVKIKQMSNSTIDTIKYISAANSSVHVFSVSLNIPRLMENETTPAYQINTRAEPITINITNISCLKSVFPNNLYLTQIRLIEVNVSRLNPTMPIVTVPPFFREVYVDGGSTPVKPTRAFPVIVNNNISIIFNSAFFEPMSSDQSRMFVNFTFDLSDGANAIEGRCINSTFGNQLFEYDYDPTRVTQPRLEPGIVEVAVW
jgi:hypothetical protein